MVGRLLRGSGIEAERVAACLQEGIKLLFQESTPADHDHADRRVTFEVDGVTTEMEEYEASGFRAIRAAFGIEEVEHRSVLRSAGRATDMRHIDTGAAGSKSPSWFLVTGEMRYMLKTCSRKEANLLLSLLPDYLAHVQRNPKTLLPRFYGLYCVRRGGRQTCFFVMGNVLAGRHPIVARFDLKGSTHGRSSSSKELAKGASATLKDLDFLDAGSPLVLSSGDKELGALLGTIDTDCAWLQSHRLIDYSMMVGLATAPANSAASVDRHVVRALPLAGAACSANLAYVGIIDILTTYTLLKRLENLKSLLLGDISCQPPEVYARRFSDFMRHIFAAPGGPAYQRNAFRRAWLERRRRAADGKEPILPAKGPVPWTPLLLALVALPIAAKAVRAVARTPWLAPSAGT